MRKDDILDVSNAYSYKLDLNKIKQELPKASKKYKASAKRYVCIDLEMTEFTASQRSCVPGANGEVIQFGYTGAAQEEEAEETSIENIAEDLQLLDASPLVGLINNEEIANLCSKYNIEIQSWLRLATEVINTQEMQVV